MAQSPQDALAGLFGVLDTVIAAQQVLNDLPLVGDDLANTLPNFSALSAQLQGALALLGPGATAARIAQALDQLVPGVTARTSGTDVDISFNLSDTITSPTLNTRLDLGVPGIALDLAGSFGVSFVRTLTLNTRLDTLGGGLTLLDNGTPEFSIGLAVDASVSGKGTLGPLEVQALDKQPGHEIALDLSFDLRSLDPADVVVGLSGQVDFREALKVSLGSPLLPFIGAELEVLWRGDNGGFGNPKVSFNKLGIGLGGIIGQLADALKPVLDIIESQPFKQVYDALIEPLPLLDEGLGALGLTSFFDTVPVLQKDHQVSVLDLYALKLKNDPSADAQELYSKLVIFTESMSILRQLAAFRAAGTDLGDAQIELGSYSFTGGAAQIDIARDVTQAATNLVNKALDLIKNVPALKAITGVAEHVSFGDKSLATLLSQDESGLTIPLLDEPSDALRLLLPKLFGPETVTFVAFEIPEQRFNEDRVFPVFSFPPLQAIIGGKIDAYLDFKVGYDSGGIYDAQGNLHFRPLEGIFLQAARADNILAYLDFGLKAGLGLGFGTAIGTYIEGGIEGEASITLPGRIRLSDIEAGAFLRAKGKIDAVLDVLIQVGFGPFKYIQRFDIVRETLVDFDSSGGAGRHTAPQKGLAETYLSAQEAAYADKARLNAGIDAQKREIRDAYEASIADLNGDVDEVYHLSPALNAVGEKIVGAITVSAFGLKETYGSADKPLLMVVANDMGVRKDALVATADFALPIQAHGGDEADHLEGGAANDTLFGDNDEDILLGGAGDDSLVGGEGDDLLSGGAGADVLDGGNGLDIVSYAKSKVGVSFSYVLGVLLGRGGDAEGDILFNMDDFEGSAFNDSLIGNDQAPSVLKGNDGNDSLIGGEADDYLLGGAGADLLDGRGGNNATSYLQSSGPVLVSLLTGTAAGADAQGDRLRAIHNVQGSAYDDLLHGGASANRLDGWNGDDVLEGFGGPDTVTGGFGDDVVFAGADGDLLDGGPGTDLLSYAHVEGRAVTVNLKTGNGGGGDSLVRVGSVNSFENLTGTALWDDDLTGDIRDNLILGLGGLDALRGEAGSDTLIGGTEADLLDGGEGIDLADYIGSSLGVTVRLALGTGARGDAEGDTFIAIENLRGTVFGDTLLGNDADNEIDPVLTTGNFFGPDSVDGMGGIDILVLDYSRRDHVGGVTGGFDINSGNGSFVRARASGLGFADQVQFSNMELLRVTGTRLGDTLYGGAGGDLLIGGGGDDLIQAGLGFDQVFAGDGNDRVIGGTDPGRQYSFLGGGTGFLLDGGSGIDTVSVSLAALEVDVTLAGTDGSVALSLTNLSMPDGFGAGIVNFEILGDVITGSGADTVSQPGRFDNGIGTGDGMDSIAPGLGTDTVNGGRDYVVGRELGPAPGRLGGLAVSDRAAFTANSGDLLVLDYAALGGAVSGMVTAHAASFALGSSDPYRRVTNAGSYATVAGDVKLAFDDIERMIITGSRFADLLVGSHRNGLAFDDDPSLRGRDLLQGGAGNDTLIGNSGSDSLFGGAGDDTLIGTRQDGYPSSDVGIDNFEVDELWGGSGADRFMLAFAGVDPAGNAIGGSYYSIYGDFLGSNLALIRDFTPAEGDRLVLFGREGDYAQVYTGDNSIQLFHATVNSFKLVAEVLNTRTLSGAVEYLAPGQAAPMALQPAAPGGQFEPEQPEPQGLNGGAGLLLVPQPTVTTTADPNELLAGLFPAGGTGLVTDSLELTGDARAFGTFGNDLLGLGSGILLSTGKVADLVGPNLENGGTTRPSTISLNFTKVGRVDDSTDLYRADLSDLGIDLRSLSIQDGNSRTGGSAGIASGFDLSAVVLSRTLLTAADFIANVARTGDLNNTGLLPKLNVFDFSGAAVQFNPGSQRAPQPTDPAQFPIGRDLLGSVNGQVNFAGVTLGRFDDGFMSLGDGGSVAFNLKSAVAAGGPLYLYVGEYGATGEDLSGSRITASSSRFDTAAGDLSTDFGSPGTSGDTAELTYKFHKAPGAHVNTVAFQFALFSEELREFAGSDFNDTFRITLNGTSLARLSDGAALTVNNLLAQPVGPGHADLIINPVAGQPGSIDIRADSYTRMLTFQGALQDGENTLTIAVQDARDGLLDSGILVKAGSLGAYYQPPSSTILPVDTVLPVRHLIDAEGPRLVEGQAGGTDFIFTIRRVNDVSQASDVDWQVPGDLFIDGADFVGGVLPTGRLHFDAGQASATLTIRVAGDRIYENDDTFQLVIGNPSVGTVGDPLLGTGTVATATILNDDVQYALIQPGRAGTYTGSDGYTLETVFRRIAIAEGSGGATEASFVVTRQGDVSGSSSVGWATVANGFAGNLEAADFAGGVAPGGRVDFAPGETARTITFSLAADTTAEPDETLFLHLIDREDNSYPRQLDGVNFLEATIVDDDRGLTGVELVSGNARGEPIGGLQTISSFPNQANLQTISADGRYVVFDSNRIELTSVNQAPPIYRAVFRKDMLTGALEIVSAERGPFSDPVLPDALNSHSASISGNGRYVAFVSGATDLEDSPKDASFAGGVFVRDMQTGAIRLAYAAQDSAGSFNPSQAYYFGMARPMVSDDGNIVAFISDANVSPTDEFYDNGLFVTNLRTGGTIRADSLTLAAGPASVTSPHGVLSATMSADGSRLAFTSRAAHDTVEGAYSFVADLLSATLTAVTHVQPGFQAEQGGAQFGAGISADGRFIVTAESALAQSGGSDLRLSFFREALGSGAVTPINPPADIDAASTLPYATSISSDGRFVLYLSRAAGDLDSQVVVKDLLTGASARVVGTDYQGIPLPEARSAVLSADGAYITFNALPQVYRVANPLAPARYSMAGHDVALEGQALEFVVTRTRSDTAETVTYTLLHSNNQAQAGADFAGTGGQVSFAIGERVKAFTVQTLIDGDDREDVEYVFPTLVATSGAGRIIAPGPEGTDNFAEAWGLIVDADLTVAPAAGSQAIGLAEGDSGETTFHYVLVRGGATGMAQTIAWRVAGAGTDAADAADFSGGVLPSGSVTFAPGATEAFIDIRVTGDSAAEHDEAFTLAVGDVAAWATGTIRNDDLPPAHRVVQSGLSVAEGSDGVTVLHLTIARDHALDDASSVDWALASAGANPASADDFVGASLPGGTAFFLPGQSTADVVIRIVADRAVEPDETVSIILSNPAGGTVGVASAIATLLNDDTAIGFSTDSVLVSQAEGQAGATVFSFTVLRTGDVSATASVAWTMAASDVSPADHADFDGGALPSGTLFFAEGQTQQTITLRASGDVALEADEGFIVTLATTDASPSLLHPTARGSILNDDLPASHTLALRQAEMTEGGSPLTLTVLRTNDITTASTVAWSVSGTGTNPTGAADFQGIALPGGSLDFAAGETRRDIVLAVRDDGLVEPDESFVVSLAQPGGGGDLATTVTLHSNDPARSLRLTATADFLPGGPAPDLYLAQHDTFSAGDWLDGAGGGNRAELQGGGLFDLRLPDRLANLARIIAIELQPTGPDGGLQTVLLRDGLALRVDVVSGAISPTNTARPAIVIEGSRAANVIQLGHGDARVVLRDASETVLGGGGRNVFVVDATTIAATIDGGTGASVLEVKGGGIVRMGASITRVETVTLLDAATDYDVTASLLHAIRLTGSARDDVVRGGAGNDVIDGNPGADTIVGGGGDDSIDGGAGDDSLAGGAGANVVRGGSGDDVLVGAGPDTLLGGVGDDTYVVLDLACSVGEEPGQGVDTLYAGADDLTGAPNLEIVRLFGGATRVSGSAGGEQIVASSTADSTIRARDGDDTLWGTGRANTLFGEGGDDIIRGGGGAETMIGGLGNDQLVIRSLDTTITELAGEGIDTAWLAVSGFTLQAHIEIGRLAAPGAVLLNGSDGAEDLVANQAEASTLNGHGGHDVLWGSGFADTLNGGAGDDIMRGQGGADVMAGGAGNDQYVVFSAEASVTEAIGGGYDIVYVAGASGLFTLGQDIEEARLFELATGLVGADGAELLVGNNAGLASLLRGNGGNDTLYGTAGADTLAGGAGDDTIYATGGADVIEFGGPGGWGTDLIGGFEAGAQLRFLASSGVAAFSDLAVNVANGNTQLSHANGIVLVFGAVITEADCLFG